MEQDATIEPESLESLKHKFQAFVKDVSLYRELKKQHGYWGHVYGPHCATLQWSEAPFAEAITATQKLCPNISTRQIGSALRDLMIRVFENQMVKEDEKADVDLESIADILDLTNIKEELSELVHLLQGQAQPQIVFVPIEGLALKTKNLTIGTVMLCSHHREDELDQTLQNLQERTGRDMNSIKEDLQNVTCYAKVEIIGDDDFTRDEAVRRTVEAVQILNLYLSSSRHQPYWSSIRIAHVIINQTLVGEAKHNPIGYRQSFPTGRLLELDWKTKQEIVEWGLEELSTCFQPQNNSEIAKRIRRAVIWYSKAVDADSPEEKFVNLTVALESLLVGDEGKGPYATTGSINQNIGERVAFLLGDSFENRTLLEETAKELYGLRSAIVHRGEPISPDKLAQMDELVAQVTLTFLKHNFATWSAFREWIAYQRYDKQAA